MMNCGIYMIRHKESGKTYVGRSVDIKNRWNLHRRDAEMRKNNSPFHRALRKYGFDAFDWKVLISAPARLHVVLERQFICDMNTAVPQGYNVGGAAGGQPPRGILALMGEDERNEKLAEMRELAGKMHVSVRERRAADPAYDAWYKERMKQAAITRETARKERMASDPVYADKERARRQRGGTKSAETIKQKAAQDGAFAEKMRAHYKQAAKKARENDPRTIAARVRETAKCL